MSVSHKITDLLNCQKPTFSFELTPNITMDVINNLTVEPSFFSITWHAKTHQCENLDIGPLKLACELRARGKDVLLHLSCDLLTRQYLNALLRYLQEKGICNLFLILGESYDRDSSEFRDSNELLQYIRKTTGSYFCIGVAGFPGHKRRLHHLKKKIDSGADFIITQAFFEYNTFENFIEACSDVDISVPIIPGIFVYETHQDLIGFMKICKVKASNDLLELVKSQNQIIIKNIIKNLVLHMKFKKSSGHFHFFTMNKLDRVSDFVKNIMDNNL